MRYVPRQHVKSKPTFYALEVSVVGTKTMKQQQELAWLWAARLESVNEGSSSSAFDLQTDGQRFSISFWSPADLIPGAEFL